MIVLKRDNQIRLQKGQTDYVIHVAGQALTFRRRQVRGRLQTIAIFPSDHLQAPAVRASLSQFPEKWELVEDHGVLDDQTIDAEAAAVHAERREEILSLQEEVSKSDTTNDPVEAAVVAALGNGWETVDIDGTSQNDDLGPAGGYSTTAGLTLAQMVLTAPPPEWPDLREVAWPWEVEGWAAPAGFVPPTVGSKVESTQAETEPEPEAPTPVLEDGDPEIGGPDGDPVDTDIDTDTSSTDLDPEETEPEPESGLPALSWHPEAVRSAVGVVRTMLAEIEELGNGDQISFRKAGHRIRKEVPEIEKVSQAEFDTLLQLAQAD